MLESMVRVRSYPGPGGARGGGCRCIEDIEDMVWVRSECIIGGGCDEEVMVCDRPGPGEAPKMLA